jgi:shikimate kinase
MNTNTNLFMLIGSPGSGKTPLAKKLKKVLSKNYSMDIVVMDEDVEVLNYIEEDKNKKFDTITSVVNEYGKEYVKNIYTEILLKIKEESKSYPNKIYIYSTGGYNAYLNPKRFKNDFKDNQLNLFVKTNFEIIRRCILNRIKKRESNSVTMLDLNENGEIIQKKITSENIDEGDFKKHNEKLHKFFTKIVEGEEFILSTYNLHAFLKKGESIITAYSNIEKSRLKSIKKYKNRI